MSFGEIDPSEWRGGEQRAPVPATKVTFSRRELDRILSLYGRKVAAGEAERLEDLLPDFTEFILSPYLGPDEAERLAAPSA